MINEKIVNKCLKIAKAVKFIKRSQIHYSFLVKKNKILSIGINNLRKTHPIAKFFNYRFYNIHSELMAILNYRKQDFSNLTMINIRLNKNKLMFAKPCRICQKLLKHYGVSTVIYSNDNSNQGETWKTLTMWNILQFNLRL